MKLKKNKRLCFSIRKLMFGWKIKLRRLLENRKCVKGDEDLGKAFLQLGHRGYVI